MGGHSGPLNSSRVKLSEIFDAFSQTADKVYVACGALKKYDVSIELESCLQASDAPLFMIHDTDTI